MITGVALNCFSFLPWRFWELLEALALIPHLFCPGEGEVFTQPRPKSCRELLRDWVG